MKLYLWCVVGIVALFAILPTSAQRGDVCSQLTVPENIELQPDFTQDEITIKLMEQGILNALVSGLEDAESSAGRANLELAISLTDTLIEDYPDYAMVYLYRGCANRALEETRDAQADFEKFLELNEDADLADEVTAVLEDLGGDRPTITNQLDKSSGELPTEIKSFEDSWQMIMREFQMLGAFPSDGELAFNDANEVFTNPWFTKYAFDQQHHNYVMAATIQFTPSTGGENIEKCSLQGRAETLIEGRTESITQSLDVGVVYVPEDEEFFLVAVDYTTEDGNYDGVQLDLESGEPIHVMAVVIEDQLWVYANGEILIDELEVRYRPNTTSGFYIFSMLSEGSCRADNLWAYHLPDTIEFNDCVITADRAANKRAGPGTNFERAGQMTVGEETPAISYAIDGQNFVWWQLEDETWVREDVALAKGMCLTLPHEE